eukprot:jgi/Mesvir1/22883/Mv19407-RA.1
MASGIGGGKMQINRPVVAAVTVLIIFVMVLQTFKSPLQGKLQHSLESVRGMGMAGPVTLAVLHVASIMVCFPAAVLFELAAGSIYGFVRGVGLVVITKNVAASLTFLLARSSLQGLVRAWVSKSQFFTAVYEGVSRDGCQFVLLARLSVLPSWVINYTIGLTETAYLRGYFLPTLAGGFPMLCQNVYVGSTLTRMALGSPVASPHSFIMGKAMLVVSVIGLVLLIRQVRAYTLGAYGLDTSMGSLEPAPTLARGGMPPRSASTSSSRLGGLSPLVEDDIGYVQWVQSRFLSSTDGMGRDKMAAL